METTKEKIEITREKFESYETVRESGVTNMFDVPTVCSLSGLTKEEAMDIMRNYREYVNKFPGVRE